MGSVADISDEELLRRAVRSLVIPVKRGWVGVPLWSSVMHTLALGSTYSAQLCLRFGLDPDQSVRRPK